MRGLTILTNESLLMAKRPDVAYTMATYTAGDETVVVSIVGVISGGRANSCCFAVAGDPDLRGNVLLLKC